MSAFLDVTTSSGCASPRSPSSPVSPLRRRSLRPKSKESCEPTEISFHLPPEPPELEAEAHEALEGPGEPGPAATEQSPVSLGAASPVSEPGLSGAGPDGVAAAAGGAASEPKIDELSLLVGKSCCLPWIPVPEAQEVPTANPALHCRADD